MTILSWTLWVLVLASVLGVCIGGGLLAHDHFGRRWRDANHVASVLLTVSTLLGLVVAVVSTTITAMT